jgi:hypothetical protein
VERSPISIASSQSVDCGAHALRLGLPIQWCTSSNHAASPLALDFSTNDFDRWGSHPNASSHRSKTGAPIGTPVFRNQWRSLRRGSPAAALT